MLGRSPELGAGHPGASGLDKRRTAGGAKVKQYPRRGLREHPTAGPEPGSAASGPASSPASLACDAAVRDKIAGGGAGWGQRGASSKRTGGLGQGGGEVLAHLFVFLADQLLCLGQRQHGQWNLCGAPAGKLTRRWGKGTGIKGRTHWLGGSRSRGQAWTEVGL